MADDQKQDFRLQNPFSLLMVGKSGVGKSVKCFQILKAAPLLYSDKPGPIYYFYQSYQDLFEENKALVTKYFEGCPSLDFLEKLISKTKNCTVVLDDLGFYYQPELQNLFTVLKHHKFCNVIVLHHQIFNPNPIYNVILKNTNYMIYWRNLVDSLEINTLMRRMEPVKFKKLLAAFEHSASFDRGYLFFDFNSSTDKSCRYRSNVFFEDSHPMRVYQL